jgi:hypothetical protein
MEYASDLGLCPAELNWVLDDAMALTDQAATWLRVELMLADASACASQAYLELMPAVGAAASITLRAARLLVSADRSRSRAHLPGARRDPQFSIAMHSLA